VPVVQPVLQELPVLLVQPVQPDRLDLLAQLEPLVWLVLAEHREQLERVVPMVSRVLLEHLVL